MSYKWNSNQILEFLDIFEKYNILWDVNNINYSNKFARQIVFRDLLREVSQSPSFVNTDSLTLKTKIKMIKNVYRQELLKVTRLNKGGQNLYRPKLVWFAKADSFLRNVTNIRVADDFMNPEGNIESEAEDSTHHDDISESRSFSSHQFVPIPSPQQYAPGPSHYSPSHSAQQYAPSPSTQQYASSPVPPTTQMAAPTRPIKRKRFDSDFGNIDKAIYYLKEVMEKTEDEGDDEYTCFGKHIAAQLRQLPVRSYLLLQEEIQKLIIRERINHLPVDSAEERHENPLDIDDSVATTNVISLD